jgi:phospholipid transport system substrate-binding protein
MKFNQVTLCGLCLIFITLLPISSAYSQNMLSPQKTIQDASDKLHKRLQDQSSKKDFAKITQFVNEVIYPHTDFDKITQLVLGEIWKTATLDDRERFKHEFQTLFIRTYARTFAEFKDWSAHVLPIDMEPGANKVVVKTEILQPGIQPVGVNYRMFLSRSGQWKIYDIIIEGTSLVTNYRTTFSNEVQQKDSLSTVIDELAKVNAEALSSRSPVASSDSAMTSLAHDDRAEKVGASHSSNCPTTLTLGTKQFEIRALKEKLYTKAELDKYYESLISSLEEAKDWVAKSGGQPYGSYLDSSYEHMYALYGCTTGYGTYTSSGNQDICGALKYDPRNGEGYTFTDTITSRIELYRCHKNAGWPTATGNGTKSSKKEQCDVSNLNNAQEVHGFVFKIVDRRGDKMVEGSGGPCRAAGIEKIVTSLESAAFYAKGNSRQDKFFSLMGNYPSSGAEFIYPIEPNTDYAASTRYFTKQWRDAESVGSPSAAGLKETVQFNECIEMNHQKYEIAFNDWIAANANNLKNCSTADK